MLPLILKEKHPNGKNEQIAFEKMYRFLDSMREELRKGQITYSRYRYIHDSAFFVESPLHQRFSGTAIFLFYKGNYYLITARHVIVDTSASYPNQIFRKIMLVDDYTTIQDHSKDIIIGSNVITKNYELTTLDQFPDIFCELSSKNDDIGIIKLTGIKPLLEGKWFVETLIKRGYTPITIEDIDTVCNITQNQKIMAIGYPIESTVGYKNLPKALYNWEAQAISIPMVTKGEISDVGKGKNDFQGNIFYYHGNSGGPSISNNKLIGIVSSFTQTPTYTDNKKRIYFLYNSDFKKSSLIYTLLKKLESKVQFHHMYYWNEVI